MVDQPESTPVRSVRRSMPPPCRQSWSAGLTMCSPDVLAHGAARGRTAHDLARLRPFHSIAVAVRRSGRRPAGRRYGGAASQPMASGLAPGGWGSGPRRLQAWGHRSTAPPDDGWSGWRRRSRREPAAPRGGPVPAWSGEVAVGRWAYALRGAHGEAGRNGLRRRQARTRLDQAQAARPLRPGRGPGDRSKTWGRSGARVPRGTNGGPKASGGEGPNGRRT
jgi:hypothetical protein